jgi:hypothetical protein
MKCIFCNFRSIFCNFQLGNNKNGLIICKKQIQEYHYRKKTIPLLEKMYITIEKKE